MIALVARLLMLSAQEDEAIRVGEEGLAMADTLGAGEVKAAALVNIGSARAALGEDRGLDEIAHGVEVARAANAAFEMCRGMGNLAARLWARGQLAEATRRWREAEREAENYGQKGFARWFHGVLVPPQVELGEWDAAAARANAFISDIEAGSPHYLGSQAYIHRARIRLARGETDGAAADAEFGLELARRAKDPQAIYPACAEAAHVFMEIGERERALAPAEEFLAGAAEGHPLGLRGCLPPRALLDAHEAGRGEECASALELHLVPLCQDRARLRPRRPGRRRRSVRRDRRARPPRRTAASLPPAPATSPSSSPRSRSTARSARRGMCARARRCWPRRPSCCRSA